MIRSIWTLQIPRGIRVRWAGSDQPETRTGGTASYITFIGYWSLFAIGLSYHEGCRCVYRLCSNTGGDTAIKSGRIVLTNYGEVVLTPMVQD